MNKEVANYLNETVATYGLFYIKLHQHHFYVKGPDFFTLHEKFEELYETMHEQFDEAAERLVTIGGKPYATLKEYIDHSIIKEKPYDGADEKEMVVSTVSDLRTLSEHLEKGIKLTGDTGDEVTQDRLVDYRTEIDKNIWMFQAFLGKSPQE
ncbi:MAG: DNA starvation/stationary phase protection protein [Pisciglobus halotolerans]|nr:DNA starvation/stationary phase protection protein [Pisciglobus halotolerans]